MICKASNYVVYLHFWPYEICTKACFQDLSSITATLNKISKNEHLLSGILTRMRFCILQRLGGEHARKETGSEERNQKASTKEKVSWYTV